MASQYVTFPVTQKFIFKNWKFLYLRGILHFFRKHTQFFSLYIFLVIDKKKNYVVCGFIIFYNFNFNYDDDDDDDDDDNDNFKYYNIFFFFLFTH